jgi:hypothetical protein
MSDHSHVHSSGLFPVRKHTGVWWRDHSLSIILVVLLVVQTLYAIWSGHHVWLHEQPYGPEASLAWSLNFWVWWTFHYNISLVADSFGVVLIVLLSKWFREKGSAESN